AVDPRRRPDAGQHHRRGVRAEGPGRHGRVLEEPGLMSALLETSPKPARTSGRKKAGPEGASVGGSALRRNRRKRFGPFVGPAWVFYTVLFVVPIIASIWISFHQWPGAGPMEWKGLDNYLRLMTDTVFLTSFGNTLLLLFVVGAAIFVL